MNAPSSAMAYDIAHTAAIESSSGHEVATKLLEASVTLHVVQESIREQFTALTGQELPGELSISGQDLRNLADAGIIASQEASDLADMLPGENDETLDLPEIEDQLRETGESVRDVISSTQVDELDDYVAGEAYQGVSGSSVIDLTKAIEQGSAQIIDAEQLADTKKHEEEHAEEQAMEWNAESVDIGAGKTLTRRDVSEVGAMSVQKTLGNVSEEYREIFGRVTSMVTAEEARDAARSGDLLGLANTIRDERGLKPLPAGESSITA